MHACYGERTHLDSSERHPAWIQTGKRLGVRQESDQGHQGSRSLGNSQGEPMQNGGEYTRSRAIYDTRQNARLIHEDFDNR